VLLYLIAGPSSRVIPAVVAATLVVSLGAGAPPLPDTDQPRIVELYPNPAADGDDGEFVTLWIPPDTDLGEYALADEHARAPLSRWENGTGPRPPPDAGMYVTVSTHPALTAPLTDRRVAAVDDRLQLANGGDRVRLLRDGAVIDELRYGRAPEGDVYNATAGRWRPLGATDRPVVTDTGGTVEAFVLPDEPDRAIELLANANERILLAGYTFTSRRVADALLSAHRRGVRVEVLLDGSPVGGMSERSATALDELAAAGIPVRVVGGERARYRFHHAKYAIVDDRALVTSENWKPAGVGGQSSRGWAALTGQDRIVEGLLETYRADAGWADAIPWEAFEPTLVEAEPANGEFPSQFDARSVPVDRTRLLVAPDNAEAELVSLVESAEESIDVQQVRIGSRGLPLLQAVLDAAERGVEVRILLSGAWYVREENEQLATWLEEQAAAGDLPLSVRIAEPDGRFEKIHAKGLIVDGEAVAVGSANWNENSLGANREVLVVLEGEAVAGYFGEVFDADWGGRGSSPPVGSLPLGWLAAIVGAVILAVLVFRRVEFGVDGGTGPG
jgi:phosphatidylserine/phosphatidylglycerophosphate/cardiolipin synthase-like enzyme